MRATTTEYSLRLPPPAPDTEAREGESPPRFARTGQPPLRLVAPDRIGEDVTRWSMPLDLAPPRSGSLSQGLRRQGCVVLAVAPLVFAIACGANVPAKPEAASALSKALASTLSRTLPSLTYCMTANPDFSFQNMGQADLVATFQNLEDKGALYEAVTAGIVRIELREFRFDPAGRSPDRSCDALHAQSRQNGYRSGQIRLAVVRTTLTPKATASGVQLDTPIAVATRELVEVTDVRLERGGSAAVKYRWQWTPTTMAGTVGYTPAAAQDATARLRQSDGQWRVESTGVK